MQPDARAESVETVWYQTGAIRRPLQFLPGALKSELEAAPLFYRLFLPFVAISFIASVIFGDSIFGPASNYVHRLKLFVLIGLAVACLYLAFQRIFNRPEAMSDANVPIISAHVRDILVRTISAVLTYILFMGCFLYWKMKITWVNPFSWDATFADIDALLFGGNNAFDALSFLQTSTFTTYLDTAYGFWGVMCVTFWVLAAVLPRLPRHVRHQYWLACLLTWLFGGLLLATLFSSAGPIYFSAVTGDSTRFAALDQYLSGYGYDLLVNYLKDMLWSAHNGSTTEFGGISAMPSMHNAQALLFVLVAVHMGRLYLFLALPLALLIFIGSMHLGWHYAVDTIVAYAITLPIWFLAGRLIKTEKNVVENPT